MASSFFTKKNKSRKRNSLRLESLEQRQLMAADLGAANDLAHLSDEFEDSSSIAQWQRVHQAENWNADQLQTWDIDQTQEGRMVMQPHTAVWYQNWRGPMAFKEVSGDFVITTEVTISDRDDIGGADADDVPGDGQFSLGGLMIRTPRNIQDPAADWASGSMADDGTNNGENYVFLSLGYGNGDNEFSLEVKTTRNSDSQLELTPVGSQTALLQVAKIGDSVITLYQFPGEQWQVHRRYTRTDMPETMQIGIVSYTNWEKANDFDPFVHNSTVLDGSQGFDPTPGEPMNPDLTAGFEYARFVRPDVPVELEGVDLVNTALDEQLLSFLGDAANLEGSPDQTNAAEIEAIINSLQTLEVPASTGYLSVPLPTQLADGTSLQFNASVKQSAEYELDQQYNFYAEASYYENWGGQNEKWIRGNGSDWFYLLPSGELYQWNGSFESSTSVAELGTSIYTNPSIMIDVPGSDSSVEVVGNDLIVQATSDGIGEIVMYTGSGGDWSEVATAELIILVVNAEPEIDPISDQEMSVLDDELRVQYSASDADGDPLVIIPELIQPQTYVIDQQYQLESTENYYENWGGQNEKWMNDTTGAWFYILPDGSFHQWSGDFGTSAELAQFSSNVYEDPGLLTDAEALPVNVALDGDEVVIDPVAGYTGSFDVRLRASDGVDETETQFQVIVNTTSLSLDPLGNIEIVGDSGPFVEVLNSSTDGDPATLVYSANIVPSVLEQLDEEYDLQPAENFYTNWGGANEKWLQNASGNWFYILPNGEFNAWNGSFESSELIATLEASVYEDPNLLAEPETLPVEIIVSGNELTIDPAVGYLGNFQVEVSVSDGHSNSTQIVDVSVGEARSEDSPSPVLIVIANQDFYYQEYSDTRQSLEAAGLEVVVAAATTETAMPHQNSGQGDSNGHVQPDIALADVSAADYSTIAFVGGWGSSAYQYAYEGTYANGAYNGSLDTKTVVNDLINDFVDQDKYVTAICHGVSVLAWARVDGGSLLDGHTVSAWANTAPAGDSQFETTRQHIEANGAIMVASGSAGDPTTVSDDVIVDGRIITAENYDSAAMFGSVIGDLISEPDYVEHVDQIFAEWE